VAVTLVDSKNKPVRKRTKFGGWRRTNRRGIFKVKAEVSPDKYHWFCIRKITESNVI